MKHTQRKTGTTPYRTDNITPVPIRQESDRVMEQERLLRHRWRKEMEQLESEDETKYPAVQALLKNREAV